MLSTINKGLKMPLFTNPRKCETIMPGSRQHHAIYLPSYLPTLSHLIYPKSEQWPSNIRQAAPSGSNGSSLCRTCSNSCLAAHLTCFIPGSGQCRAGRPCSFCVKNSISTWIFPWKSHGFMDISMKKMCKFKTGWRLSLPL